jgi:hypothetical protein
LQYGFVGEFHEVLIRRPILGLAAVLRRIDSRLINAAVEGTGPAVRTLSGWLRRAFSGHAQHYGLLMTAGILGLFLLVWLLQ